MLGSRASAGLQAAQPHLEDGSVYRQNRPTKSDTSQHQPSADRGAVESQRGVFRRNGDSRQAVRSRRPRAAGRSASARHVAACGREHADPPARGLRRRGRQDRAAAQRRPAASLGRQLRRDPLEDLLPQQEERVGQSAGARRAGARASAGPGRRRARRELHPRPVGGDGAGAGGPAHGQPRPDHRARFGVRPDWAIPGAAGVRYAGGGHVRGSRTGTASPTASPSSLRWRWRTWLRASTARWPC